MDLYHRFPFDSTLQINGRCGLAGNFLAKSLCSLRTAAVAFISSFAFLFLLNFSATVFGSTAEEGWSDAEVHPPLAAKTRKKELKNRHTLSKSAQQGEGEKLQEGEAKPKSEALIVTVPLPVKSKKVRSLKAAIEKGIADYRLPKGDPPVLVLQFDTAGNVDGTGSSYSACDELASFLTSKKLRAVRTIAYIPDPSSGRQVGNAGQGLTFKSQLTGHALMIALACQQIWMAEESTISGFQLDPDHRDKELHTYQSITKKGSKWPPAVVATLLGQSGGLFQVKKTDGRIVYVDKKERQSLNQKGLEIRAQEIGLPGTKAVWSSRQLFEWTFIDTPILNRSDLAQRLDVTKFQEVSTNLESDKPNAAIIEVNVLDSSFADWAPRAIGSSMTGNKINLLFVQLKTLGAESMPAAARFAEFLSTRDKGSLETVALLPDDPTPGELLVAMACDKIFFPKDGTIGPVDQSRVASRDQSMLDEVIKGIGKTKGRDWSLIQALVLNRSDLAKYRNRLSGTTRIITEEHFANLEDSKDWVLVEEVNIQDGISANSAFELRIVDDLVSDLEKVQDRFLIADWRVIQPNFSDRSVQRFAQFVSSPGIASLVIMLAMFTLFIELSAPGLGVPGFISACLFSLFFWANYFEGNAAWLELILFVLGLLFLAAEIFVVPGFGVFGVGGILCVSLSLLLAGQDFVIPQTKFEKQQLVYSLFTLATAAVGVFGGIYFVKRYFKSIPVLKRMVLEAPSSIGTLEQESQKESYQKYLNQVGTTVTVMRPGGRIRIGSEILEASSEGPFLEKGTQVIVCNVEFSRITVREKEG